MEGSEAINGGLEAACAMEGRLRVLDSVEGTQGVAPVEVAEFAKAKGVDDEVVFAC
jgi:hypothetical protein